MTDPGEKQPKQPTGPVRKILQTIQGSLTAPEKWACRRGWYSPARERLPDFLGIGAQKAGSSWLWENLRCHPELYLPEQKELHFFDRRYHRSLRFYESKFANAGGRVKGEITPAYSTLPADRIALIRSIMPELRLVMLIRDPVERAWSHALMHLLDKVSVRSFQDVAPSEFLAHFSSADSRSKGNYLEIIDNWTSAFPPDQLFVGFFEDIQTRPEALFREILQHIGLDPEIDPKHFPFGRVVNRGRGTPMPPEFRSTLMELYRDELAELHRRFGGRVAGWGGGISG